MTIVVSLRMAEEKKSSQRCKTRYVKALLDNSEASNLFRTLRDNTKWGEGIRSKKGHTRLAATISLEDNPIVEDVVVRTLMTLNKDEHLSDYAIHGVYLNYYRGGDDYTPTHSHAGTHQLVISLTDGCRRTLVVGKKEYSMGNGDVILFGSSPHGVPKQETRGERISIATFMTPVS